MHYHLSTGREWFGGRFVVELALSRKKLTGCGCLEAVFYSGNHQNSVVYPSVFCILYLLEVYQGK